MAQVNLGIPALVKRELGRDGLKGALSK